MQKRLFFLCAAALLCFACKASPNAQMLISAGADAYQAATLSDSAVTQLGRQTALAMDKENSTAPEKNAHSLRLAEIAASLQRVDGLDLNYKIYLTKDVNAFALPDGSIRVYAGLMDLMTNDEIYFVIGHEIGHVKNGDTKDRFRVAYATSAARKGVASLGGAAAALSASELGALGEAMINARFSQAQESEADVYGLRLMEKNRKNTAAAVSALKKLASPGDNSSFLSSHPSPASRAEKIEKLRKK